MHEQYKDIINYEALYEVSNFGNVRNKRTNKILRHDISKGSTTEYHRVTLCKEGKTQRFLVHRLVALHFIDNPDNKPEINHIDNNGNNNHFSNLEWVTKSENMLHSRKQGRQDHVDTLRILEAAKFNIAKRTTKYDTLIGISINGRTLQSYEHKLIKDRIRIIGTFTCDKCSSIVTAELASMLALQDRITPLYCRSCSLKSAKMKI